MRRRRAARPPRLSPARARLMSTKSLSRRRAKQSEALAPLPPVRPASFGGRQASARPSSIRQALELTAGRVRLRSEARPSRDCIFRRCASCSPRLAAVAASTGGARPCSRLPCEIFSSCCLWLAGLGAAPARAQNFQTSVPSAILIDAGTNTVLFEKGADEFATPASTVKILTAEIGLSGARRGPPASLSDEFTVSEHAWRTGGAPAGGSAMFLAVNSRAPRRRPHPRTRDRFRQ